MIDIESRLRDMDLRPPRDLQARAMAAAVSPRRRPARRVLPLLLIAVLIALVAGYGTLTLTSAPQAAAAGATSSGYGVGEGCWFVRDAGGLHFHIGGWYRGLPALCTTERRDSGTGR